jgi:hypothetical protein
MDVPQSDREKYLAAKAHVAALKGFYIHLTVFLAVIVGLGAIDYLSGGKWWVQWPLLGWGLGVLAHGFVVYNPHALSTQSWEERKIKETMAKM